MKIRDKKTALKNVLNDSKQLIRLQNLKAKPSGLNSAPDDPVADNLANWLAKLKLLHGVPFNYLVPNVAMLPLESIRFFYCDMVWLDYLQEGALSLGRSTAGDQLRDKVFLDDLRDKAKLKINQQRKAVYGHLNNHLTDAEKSKIFKSTVSPTEKVSGFLLRSGVVKGWPGLNVEAFSDAAQTQQCQVLRFEQLSPTILLCLFEGKIQSFRIHEHTEVLHFGFDVSVDMPIVYSKSYRYPADSGSNKAGSAVVTNPPAPLQVSAYQRNSAVGVIRINDLAQGIKTSLAASPVNYTGPFTAAEFALEMAEGVESVNFSFNQDQK